MSETSIGRVLRQCRSAFTSVAIFSFFVNLLMLTGPIFMLQLYERVLPSQSIPTLVVLAAIVAFLYVMQAILDIIRTRLLARIGHRFDAELGPIGFNRHVQGKLRGAAVQGNPLKDLDQLRSFFSSQGPIAICDIPWLPLYIAVIYIIHPILGSIALGGAVIFVGLTVVTDRLSRGEVKRTAQIQQTRGDLADAGRRNAEVLSGMGMVNGFRRRWLEAGSTFREQSLRSADIIGTSSSISKVFRLFLQSALLAIGAYLAVLQEISPAAMIVASIIAARALQPVEIMVGNWRNILQTQQALQRLRSSLPDDPTQVRLKLPAPYQSLELQKVAVAPPNARQPIVQGVSFRLEAGNALGLIGPSGSGKSSLVRGMVGAWPIVAGQVRLDDAPTEQWDPELLGPHIGYVPQDIELFDGTIGENISRFDETATPDDILAAAELAGIHELILNLPDGYNLRLGESGNVLSAGQRQRVALARAVYKTPFLVILDEPNSNLDHDGEQALSKAIMALRERGSIVIVISHRRSILDAVDHLAVMQAGRMASFGPKDERLAALVPRSQKEPAVLNAPKEGNG